LTTNWCFFFDLTDKLFQTYLRLASRRSWRIGERDAMHRVSSLRHIYRSNSLYGFNLSNGILDSMPGYEAIGPRFDPESRRCYLLLIYNIQFFNL
jgi:hypothetical protein